MRRAQAVARLRHPNLVRLLPLPGGAGLAPVVGEARRLADFTLPAGTFKRFDLEQVVRLLLDVLSGLAALHEVVTDGQAFVHGQVSPQNIFIDEHGTARLVPLPNTHSMPSAKLEDVGYAAPERLAGGAFDARADVFSVGVMLWEALAGKRLFPDTSAEGLLARSLGTQAPAIRLAANLRWATPLCAIAARAIASQPAARFASALDLSNAMASAAAQQLSTVDTDAWQDEAPTPVFQPRLHLAKLRASTPPPAVLTIGSNTPVAFAESAPPAVTEEAEPLEPAASGRRGRGRGVLGVLGALALGAAVVLLLPKAENSWRNVAAAVQLAPATQPPAAVPITAPLPIPRPTPVASAAVASPSASAVGSAMPAPAKSRLETPLAKPAPVPLAARKSKAKLREHGDDYGI
jgi:Protein kinase domain